MILQNSKAVSAFTYNFIASQNKIKEINCTAYLPRVEYTEYTYWTMGYFLFALISMNSYK